MLREKQAHGRAANSFWTARAAHVRQSLAEPRRRHHGMGVCMAATERKNVFQLEPMSTCPVEVDVIVRNECWGLSFFSCFLFFFFFVFSKMHFSRAPHASTRGIYLQF